MQYEHTETEKGDFEKARQAASTKHRKKIEYARFLFEEAEISRDDYVRCRDENERMIAHWAARTTETEKKVIELSACLEALTQIVSLWPDAEGNDRLALARSLFEHLVYDLDKQQIVDFRLQPMG